MADQITLSVPDDYRDLLADNVPIPRTAPPFGAPGVPLYNKKQWAKEYNRQRILTEYRYWKKKTAGKTAEDGIVVGDDTVTVA